nr:uncharacterized protein LOC126534137 isoform X2 [Dermacentor andersoni]
MCCRKKGARATCHPHARYGKNCTDHPVKGIYKGHCNCAYGQENIQVIGLLEARRYGMKTRSERASERKLEQCCMQEKLRGEKCEFTRQCKDGLCCLKKGSYGPTCQPIAQLREKCTTRAVDGVYKIRCPCADHARCHVRIHICVSARKVLNSTIGASKS